MMKTSLNYYKLQILNLNFSWQPNRPCWLQSKVHIQFIFYFLILLIKLSYSIHPFHASFHIHPFHASFHIHRFYASFHIHPFHTSLHHDDILDEVQDEFTELRNDSTAHDLLQEKTLTEFWCAMCHSYPNVGLLSLQVLMPFATSYLCESCFSTLCKLKQRQEIDWMFKMT